MPNEYWARKAIKQIKEAYPDREVKGEIFDMGNRAGVLVGDVLVKLRPDDDPLAKAQEALNAHP